MRTRGFIAALATTGTLALGSLGAGAVVPGTALSAAPATAATSQEASLLALTNQARAAVGAAPLSLEDSISSVARSWAGTMAGQGAISHNPDLGSAIDGWSRLGENVGVGSSIDQVHQALLASPSHYSNLTNAGFSLVGIGVASGGGRLYVVEDFEQPAGGGRSAVVPDTEPPVSVARPVPATVAPPPAPPPVRTAPPIVTTVPAPEPVSSVSTIDFVLDALRALDSLHHHG